MNENNRICPPLNRGVMVLGAEMTKFSVSKVPKTTLRDLAAEAAEAAMTQAGVTPDEIDFVVVSNAVAGVTQGQVHTNALIVSHLGLNPVPSVRVESACAAGSVAMRIGATAIEAGFADNVLVLGTEIMSGMDRNMTQKVLAGGADIELEIPVGATFPGLYATSGMRLIHEQAKDKGVQYGMDSLAHFALQNHRYAVHNPKAQYGVKIEDLAARKDMEVWEFLNNPRTNPLIAYPLRLFDCSPISDGGAAVVLSGKDVAESYNGYKKAVQMRAISQATGHLPIGISPTVSSLFAAEKAAIAAYKYLGVDPNNPLSRIKVAEVHDCFTSAEVMALGDLHFFNRSETLDAARRGDLAIDGKIPVNTSGGLKAKGHPIGVTGISQVVTLRHQLLGEMPKPVQTQDIDLALQHNVGGTGGTAVVSIYSLPEAN